MKKTQKHMKTKKASVNAKESPEVRSVTELKEATRKMLREAGAVLVKDLPQATKTAKEPKATRPSLVNAAVQVLMERKNEPATCKELVEIALAKGVWQTNGKTPDARSHLKNTF